MTSTKNGDVHNVNVALTLGANVNVHHADLVKVSILTIVYIYIVNSPCGLF